MTVAEENYLKAIYHLSPAQDQIISTNSIAQEIQTSAASVTDMIKRLAEKKLVVYEKYKGVTLSEEGLHCAKLMIRKHRLWEVFLLEKLNFGWDEIHEIAEELEHINSETLTNRLDDFLDNPRFDPHGDPIPDARGKIQSRAKIVLSQVTQKSKCRVVGVNDSSSSFLQYLDSLEIGLGTELTVEEKIEFDGSFRLQKNKSNLSVSAMVANNIYVTVYE